MCPWDGYAPATIAFCEQRICAWVVEPSNAWSNLAYVLVGLWILARCRPLLGTARTDNGVAAILLGFGSFAFHATGVRVFEVADLSGMYLVSGLGLTFAFRRLLGWSDGQVVAFFVAVVTGSLLAMVVLGNDGIRVFAAQMLTFFVLELYLRHRNPPGAGIWIVRSGAALSVGYGIWLLDFHGPLCAPNNHLLTGHAVWHELTALAIAFFHRFQEAVGASPAPTQARGAGEGAGLMTTAADGRG